MHNECSARIRGTKSERGGDAFSIRKQDALWPCQAEWEDIIKSSRASCKTNLRKLLGVYMYLVKLQENICISPVPWFTIRRIVRVCDLQMGMQEILEPSELCCHTSSSSSTLWISYWRF